MSNVPPSQPLAPAPVPADVGLVAALAIEVAPLLAKLSNVRKYASDRHTVIEGELAGKIVAAIITGPGRKAARRGTELLLAGHRPSWILSAGFGGGLSPELKRGDLFMATSVVDPEGARLAIDLRLPTESASSRVHSGAILTVDEIVRTAIEKAELHVKHGTDVVDMETSAVARVCQERNIRLIAVRVISDDASSDLPPEIAAILGRSGGYRVGAALGAIWKRPSSVKDLWSLRETAISAADRLALFLPGVISQLS